MTQVETEPFDAALSKARTVHQLALMHFSLENNLKTKKIKKDRKRQKNKEDRKRQKNEERQKKTKKIKKDRKRQKK